MFLLLNQDAPFIAGHQSSGLRSETTSAELADAVDAYKTVNMACTSEPAEPMAHLLEPADPKGSTENVNVKLRKSFSWDRAFFTSDGVLDAEELKSMIEGGREDVKHQLQGIEEKLCKSMDSISTLEDDNIALEKLEAKLFEDIKASTQKPSKTSNPTNSSIKVLPSSRSSTPIKTQPVKSSPLGKSSGGSENNVKSPATPERRTTGSKTAKAAPGSTSKPPSRTTTKNKLPPVNSRLPSTSSVSSINRGSLKSSTTTNSRRMVDTKTGKPTADSISVTIGQKNKPPPVNSPLSSSMVLPNSSESSSTYGVNRRPISKGSRGPINVHSRSLDRNATAKSALENCPTGRNSDRNGKQPPMQTGPLTRLPAAQSTSCRGNLGTAKPATRNQSRPSKTVTRNANSNSPKTQRLPPQKIVATHTSVKPNSRKTSACKSPQERSSAKSRSVKNLLAMSPEVLDIKGKINALRMEIGMQKKDSFKETRISESSLIKQPSKDRHEGKRSTSRKGKDVLTRGLRFSSRTKNPINQEDLRLR